MGAVDVVTVTAQLGSGGFTLARSLADRLGFRYYDWEVTSQAAAAAGVSPNTVASAERVPSLVERIVERFFMSGYYAPEVGDGGLAASVMLDSALRSLTHDDYRQLIEHVVMDLAGRGKALIVGHAAQVILRDQPDVLRILIHGSPDRRAARLVTEEKLTSAVALQTILRSDRDRGAFLKRYYHVDWLDTALYDLTLNTDRLPPERALAVVFEAARGL